MCVFSTVAAPQLHRCWLHSSAAAFIILIMPQRKIFDQTLIADYAMIASPIRAVPLIDKLRILLYLRRSIRVTGWQGSL